LRWDWEAIAREDPERRPIYREPARVAILAGALMLILAMFFPFADGRLEGTDGTISRVSVSGLEGAGDGAILLLFGLIAAFIVLYRGAAESTVELVRLAPMVLGIAAILILVTAWRETSDQIGRWAAAGGTGQPAAGIWLSAAGSIVLAIAGTYRWVIRRPDSSADPSQATRPSRMELAEGIGAVVGAVVIGGCFLAVAAAVLPAAFVGLFVFVAVAGLILGVTVGSRVARRIARSA
jgi:hypothetical protein